MATSGTSAFNLEISEVIEEAFERCGLQSKTGYDIETARRSLNLLSLEWVNRGLNFWTVEQGTKTLTAGTSTVTMDSDTVDLIQYWIRDGSGTSQSGVMLRLYISGPRPIKPTRLLISKYGVLRTRVPWDLLIQMCPLVSSRHWYLASPI